jgi:Response regulator containing a CheY-like receiver domain and an HTH DNA-binding domain
MPPKDDRIRILIVDDHRMVREGLIAMLRDTKIDVVGEAETIAEALEEIDAKNPEAVLLDVRLQGQSGLTACREMTEKHPDVAVVFLTVYEDAQYVFEALRAGAKGYMLKRASADDIVNVLEQVRAGETIVDPGLAGKIAVRASHLAPGRLWPGAELGITQRESEVLRAMVDGLNNKAVAEQLVISEDTVKTHVRSIFRKLGVTDRAQAVSVTLRGDIFK